MLHDFFLMRQQDSNRLGLGMIMTEFGPREDNKADIFAIERLCELADKRQQSWMYWEFKYYHDITTITPKGKLIM
jgi:hypothetical protein